MRRVAVSGATRAPRCRGWHVPSVCRNIFTAVVGADKRILPVHLYAGGSVPHRDRPTRIS
eukprot:3196165-Prymnesium_polylepis.1